MHLTNYSLCASLDPAHEEPEVEAPADPTEEANSEPEPKQGKPRCITPKSLTFIFEFNIIMLRMIVH
jgi:hypothetical protein